VVPLWDYSARDVLIRTPQLPATIAYVRSIYFAIAALALGWSHVTWAVNPEERLAEYEHVIWRSGDQGLAGRAYSVAQTADGYLWVGTLAGLYRFDGVRFTQWMKEEEGSPNGIVKLYLSTDRSLWITGTNKGLMRVRDQKLETIDPSGRVRSMTEDARGVIWYSKFNLQADTAELCSWSKGSEPHCLPSPSWLGEAIYSYADAIWVATATGLMRFRNGTFTKLPIAGLEKNAGAVSVSALLPDGQGGLFVGLGSGPGLGLVRLRDGTLTPVKFGDLDGSRLDVTSLFKDRRGALWIGTERDGVYRVHDDRVDHFAARADSTRFVFQFTEDHEGSIWFASEMGLERFSDRRVVTVAVGDDPNSMEVDGVSVARDGTLWVAGLGTLMRRRPGAREFSAPAVVPRRSQITSIFEDHTGGMWVGIQNSLTKLEGDRFIPLKLDTGAPLGLITSLAEDRVFNLWAVSLGPPRQILKIDPRTRHVTPVPNLPAASRVAADPAGGIYVAALNGDLVHVDSLGKQVVYPHPAGRSARIPQLSVTADGTVYVATSFGLEMLKNGRIEVLDTANGLPCKVLYDAIFDRYDNLWLYMQCGLVRISKEDFAKWLKDPAVVVTTLLMGPEDGADPFDAPFGGSARTPDGVLWFSNNKALQKADPDSIARAGNAPPVHIEQFAADGTHYDPNGPVKLPPLAGNIQIDYAGLSFVAPDKVRFRYKLDGFDTGWNDVGPRRQAFYTTLPPAHYRFQVIASDNHGVWNDVGASLSFELAPAFHQTAWFKLLCGVVALALFWLILQVRVRHVAGKIRLRQSIQYTERLRIARQLHDSLLQGMQGLMLRFSSAAQAVPNELPARRLLEELLDRSDEIIRQARHSIQDLREREKRSLELAQEITALGQELGSHEFAPVTVVTNGTPYELNSDTHDNLLLVAREAMLNAFKHADASAMEVQVDYLEAEIRILVRDDGRGIDESVAKNGREGHWGLHGMRERAAAIHGRLRILSKVGAGTEVEIVVPRVYAEAK
jgi:signal transduction histidine kinase/ligand-binding sensor domain-containing protein